MNPNYKHTITVYNRLKENGKSTWQRTVLHHCFYKNVTGQVEDGKRISMSNAYTARIPESEWYRPYAEWAGMSEKERGSFFTINMDDVVVKGECLEEITGKSPHTASEILSRYKPDAFVVTAFSDNTSSPLGKHYRVGG